MAVEGMMALKDTRVAGADLSAKQYHAVKLNSSGLVIAVAGLTDDAYGILQNDPAQGEAAEICMIGITKWVADSAITLPALVGPSADGQCDAKGGGLGSATTNRVLGHARSAAANAGEIVTCVVNCVPNGTAGA